MGKPPSLFSQMPHDRSASSPSRGLDRLLFSGSALLLGRPYSSSTMPGSHELVSGAIGETFSAEGAGGRDGPAGKHRRQIPSESYQSA